MEETPKKKSIHGRPRLPKKRGLLDGYKRKFERWDPRGLSSKEKTEMIKDMLGAIEFAKNNRSRSLFYPEDYKQLRARISTMTRYNSEKKEVIKDLKTQIKELNKIIKEKEDRISSLSERPLKVVVHNKDVAIENRDEEIKELNKEIRSLKYSVEKWKKKYEEYKSKHKPKREKKPVIKYVKREPDQDFIRWKWMYNREVTAGQLEVYKISYFTEKFLEDTKIRHNHLNLLQKLDVHSEYGVLYSDLKELFGQSAINKMRAAGYIKCEKMQSKSRYFLTIEGESFVKQYRQYIKRSLKHEVA